MIYSIADNITSPLGLTTEENYRALIDGRSALRRYDDYNGVPEPFVASLFTDEQWAAISIDGLTRFESLVLRSVTAALSQAGLDVVSQRVVLILSSTKANVELLEAGDTTEREYPGTGAEKIARLLGMQTVPVTVCNACISGLSAVILAQRLLDARAYDYAIVCGADCLTRFVISGFQSFKAVSAEACRPFDMERLGLNLGEAAATIVFAANHVATTKGWGIAQGAVSNDAYHISAPSKNGEGACQALRAVTEGHDLSQLAFVNAHGTATMFNDQMESVAIERAGLSAIPVNGLKGYYGHTLGAAGVLETVISMRAADEGIVLGTRGFTELGVSGRISLSAQHRHSSGTSFVKMISGFGGCNAAVWATKSGDVDTPPLTAARLQTLHHVTITPQGATLDGQPLDCAVTGRELLTAIYRQHIGDYPKFYKMDMLSRLGFVASELLLAAETSRPRFVACSDRAVIVFNRASTVDTDKHYLDSIIREDDYFPSPSLFVYTLPNIVTGEIAIRNHYHGETSFYVLPQRNDDLMNLTVSVSMADRQDGSVLCGWLDYEDESRYCADFYLKRKI